MTTEIGESDVAGSDLEREVQKLRRINHVLMTRVERSMDMQGGDFALFEHAILLESKVRERTAALEHALSDLRHSNQALAKAKAEADRANSSKTEFLAAASHDLLQPLNAARLFVAALAETEQAEGNHSLIDNIDTAFMSVEALLNALLEISKLDTGAHHTEIGNFPLDQLLRDLVAEFKPLATDKGLTFHDTPTGLVLWSDRQLLGRILRNFISNAIRYTAAGHVSVTAEPIGDSCRIDVVDTGSGIPEDQQDEIFEEFKRLAANGGEQVHGFGLGLAIVRRIARLLDHDIEVESVPGQGSRFSVFVPLGVATEGAAGTAGEAQRQPTSASGAGVVLVIENDRSIRSGMSELLGRWGYQVLTSPSAVRDITALRDQALRPDLIIADYHLDDGDLGTDAIAALRAAHGRDVPAMIITADRSPEVLDAIAALDLPLLTKPIKPAQLRAMIRHLIRPA